ncbi:hypothetical protein P153DRAFT_290802 [Dothidotthia symphoricarpi CBS 119687]|uniref:Uncharacterized protein n=1 Tax=Dothidotthia symphoricarpi CBS 119687 TaxID=1392245 RepID=A0A6A6AEP2_9PLEO|nr:uncharacterized protein P153DRAFT_290802 [Dothidotthia symphoricarpi CBS 119687]KAF2129397.1 hypothetical protein P153DRAFT_290802 [Dothidotthia symphoricarpi CBS 119687]
MPSIALDFAAEIDAAVRQLKSERDTWQAVAAQYKAAFESQSARLSELQDICFATQAELENERVQQRRLHATSTTSLKDCSSIAQDRQHERHYGTALIKSPNQTRVSLQRQSFDDCTNPLYKRVQQSVSQRNYGNALAELERLLRGPLSSKARAEGLLLKSSCLQAAGPEELYDALAACSEALELCDRISELESFLPKIQYQRGICYYQLRMLHQAREAFNAVRNSDSLSLKANEYRRSCDDELELLRRTNRRSGFDESRGTTEGFLAQLEEQPDNKRRRTSAQLRLRAVAKAKRMSLPHRWVVPKGGSV